MKTFFNIKSQSHGTETVDELNRKDFKSHKEYRREVNRLRNEYQIAGMNVYTSKRSTNDWKNK